MPKQQKLSEGWKIDLSAWKTMRDVREFTDAQRSGDLGSVFKACSGIIKSWEFEGDPADPDAYDDLTPAQWKRTQEEVNKAVTAFFQ